MNPFKFKTLTNLIFFSFFLLFTSISLFQYLTGRHIVYEAYENEVSLLQIDVISKDSDFIESINEVMNISIIELILLDQFKTINFNFITNNSFLRDNGRIIQIGDSHSMTGKNIPIKFFTEKDRIQFAKLFASDQHILENKLLDLIQNKLILINKINIKTLKKNLPNKENIKEYIMNQTNNINNNFIENCKSYSSNMGMKFDFKNNEIEKYTIEFNCNIVTEQIIETDIDIQLKLIPELYKYNVNRNFFNNLYIGFVNYKNNSFVNFLDFRFKL